MKTSTLFLLLLTLLISGCGFHLRGNTPLTADFNNWSIHAGRIVREELQLQTNNTHKPDNPVATLTVSDEKFDRRTLSVDPATGRTREVELSFSARFIFKSTDNKKIIGPESIRVTRDYVFNENTLIGSSREENVLRQEMQRDAANQILRRLQASFNAPQ